MACTVKVRFASEDRSYRTLYGILRQVGPDGAIVEVHPPVPDDAHLMCRTSLGERFTMRVIWRKGVMVGCRFITGHDQALHAAARSRRPDSYWAKVEHRLRRIRPGRPSDRPGDDAEIPYPGAIRLAIIIGGSALGWIAIALMIRMV